MNINNFSKILVLFSLTAFAQTSFAQKNEIIRSNRGQLVSVNSNKAIEKSCESLSVEDVKNTDQEIMVCIGKNGFYEMIDVQNEKQYFNKLGSSGVPKLRWVGVKFMSTTDRLKKKLYYTKQSVQDSSVIVSCEEDSLSEKDFCMNDNEEVSFITNIKKSEKKIAVKYRKLTEKESNAYQQGYTSLVKVKSPSTSAVNRNVSCPDCEKSVNGKAEAIRRAYEYGPAAVIEHANESAPAQIGK